MTEIIEEILKFIFIIILGTFLFWTGELLISAISIGWHRPKWNGYKEKAPMKRVFCEVGVGLVGFIFWIATIPLVLKIFEGGNVV